LKRNQLWLGLALVAGGLAAGTAAIQLSETCPGDPRFACGSTAGIGGVFLWVAGLVSMVVGTVVGVSSRRRAMAAAALIALGVAFAVLAPDGIPESVYVATMVGAALALGGLLRLWAFAFIPILVLALVPLGGHTDDSDGVAIYGNVLIGSVVLFTLPFLIAGGLASLLHIARRQKHGSDPAL
jgi:hypothetical protein